jgi:hypothetical protein
MRRMRLLVLSITLGTAAALPAGLARPAGPEPAGSMMIHQARVVVRPNGGGPPRPTGVISDLFPRDRIYVTTSPRGLGEVVLRANSARYTLVAGCSLIVSADGTMLQPISGSAAPIRNGRLPLVRRLPRRPSTSIQQDVLKSWGDGRLVPRKPTPQDAVIDYPVTIACEWKERPPVPVVRYVLRVRLEGAVENLLKKTFVQGMPQFETIQFPLDNQLIQQGVTYLWSVDAQSQDATLTSCAGLFRVLLPEERDALETLGRVAREKLQASPPEVAPLLFLAGEYERLRVYDRAVETYRMALPHLPTSFLQKAVSTSLTRAQAAGAFMKRPVSGLAPPY